MSAVTPQRGALAGRRPPKPLSAADTSKNNDAFDMSTPDAEAAELRRHFIGTPSAAGILSAFLDVDDGAADDGPPLDPDYDLVTANVASAPSTPAAAAVSAEASKMSPSNESASSRSTRAGGTPKKGDHKSDEGSEEEYEDDFEACSDGDEQESPSSPNGRAA